MDTAVERFRAAAEEYRRTLEDEDSAPDLARRLRNAVARVYLAAAFLPAGEGEPRPADERPEATGLEARMGQIYDDLGRALEQLQRGAPGDLSQIRWDFEYGWGRQAVDVLRPLHHLATGQ